MKLKKLLSFALALAMVLAFVPALSLTASAATAGDTVDVDGVRYELIGNNLISNGSFEDGTTDGWTAYNYGIKALSSVWSVSTDVARDGTHSLKVTYPSGWSGGNSNDNLQSYFNIENGKIYYLSFSEYWNSAVASSNNGHMSAAAVSDGYGTDNFTTTYGGFKSWGGTNPRTYAREGGKWIDQGFILDLTNANLSTPYAVIAYSFNGFDGMYLDNVSLYEVEEVTADATVTINYVDENNDTIATAVKTVDNLYPGDAYTPTINAEYYPDETTGKLYEIGEIPTVDALVSGENVVEVPVMAYKTLVEQSGGNYNLITNGGFEENSFDGWTTKNGNTVDENYFYLTSDADNVSEGTYALSTLNVKYGDDNYSIKNSVETENEGVYYVAVDVKGTSGTNNATQYMWMSAGGNVLGGTAMAMVSDAYTTVAYITDSIASGSTISIEGNWFQDYHPYIDNFVAYQVEDITATVKINSVCGTTTLKEEDDTAVVGESYTPTNVPETLTDDENNTYVLNSIGTLARVSAVEENTVTIEYEKDSIVSIDSIDDVTTRVGVDPTSSLPDTVTANLASGGTMSVTAAWDAIDKIKYDSEGSFTATGTAGGLNISVTVNVVDKSKYLIVSQSFDGEDFAKTTGDVGQIVPVGDVLTVSGVDGKAAYFDGSTTTNYLTIIDDSGEDENENDLLVGYDDMTISMYIKSTAGSWPFFAANSTATQTWPNENYVAIYANDTGVKFERYNSDGTNRPEGSYMNNLYGCSADTWYAVTLVVEGAMNTLYVDGVQVAQTKITDSNCSSLAAMFAESGDSYIYLGHANWGSGEGYTGAVDNLNVYSVALTADEVADISSITRVKVETEDGAEVGTVATSSNVVDGRTFYYAADNTIYSFDDTTVPDAYIGTTGEFTITATPDDTKITPTRDGFITPNYSGTSFSNVEYYVNKDDGNMIYLTGYQSYNPFGLTDEFYATANPNGVTTDTGVGKTRVGYLEFTLPDEYTTNDALKLTLNVSELNSNAYDVKVAAIPAEVTIPESGDGTTQVTLDSLALTLGDKVYYSDYIDADSTQVTIDLTGIEADNGTIKLILAVPVGKIKFANEEKTTLNGVYEGETAYLTRIEGGAAEATVTVMAGTNVAAIYTTPVAEGTTTVTLPSSYAVIYHTSDTADGNYYLGSAQDVQIDATTYEGSVSAVSVGTMFSTRPLSKDTGGDDSDTNVYYSDEFDAYCWNHWNSDDSLSRDRIGFGIVSVPEAEEAVTAYYQLVETDDTKTNNQWHTGYTVATYIYAISLEDYYKMDITTNEGILAALDGVEPAFSWISESNTGLVDISSIYLDTNIVNTAAGSNGKVVLIGMSAGGLLGFSRLQLDDVQKDLGITMYKGAQIRVGGGVDDADELVGNSGLRFIAKANTSMTLAEAAEDTNGEFGIAIFDGAFSTQDDAAAIVSDLASKYASGDTVEPKATIAKDKYQDEATQVFTAAIVNLGSGNYNRVYIAVPYAEVNGKMYYDFSEAIARSPYYVASGLLTSDSTDTTYTQDDETDALNAVLNVYTNQTGVRLILAKDSEGAYTISADTSENANASKGQYSYGADAVFTAAITAADGDKLTITLTGSSSSVEFYEYWENYIRINNNNAAVVNGIDADSIVITEATEDGNATLTFTFDVSAAK